MAFVTLDTAMRPAGRFRHGQARTLFKETFMAEYAGPDCARCTAKACTESSEVLKRPSFCPAPAAAELLRRI